MKITLGATTLCDGADRAADKSAGPSGLRVSGRVRTDVANRLRAAHAVVFNRKNHASEVSFSVVRKLASVAAAETFCTLHPATVVREGTATFGEGAGAVQMPGAVLEEATCTHTGLSVHIQYRLAGGKLEEVPE